MQESKSTWERDCQISLLLSVDYSLSLTIRGSSANIYYDNCKGGAANHYELIGEADECYVELLANSSLRLDDRMEKKDNKDKQ